MFQPRIFSILAPRIYQILNWTVDPNTLSEPFLQKEDLPVYRQEFFTRLSSLQQTLYTPPAYVPPMPPPKLTG